MGKTSNARKNARARRKRLRAAGGVERTVHQVGSVIKQTLFNLRGITRRAKEAAFKKVRLHRLVKITAGGRHGWYECNLDHLVRKPLQGGKIDALYRKEMGLTL